MPDVVFATTGQPTKLKVKPYYSKPLDSIQWSGILCSPPPSDPLLTKSMDQSMDFTFPKSGNYQVIAREVYKTGEVVQFTFKINAQTKEEWAKFQADVKMQQAEAEAKRIKAEKAAAAKQKADDLKTWGSLYTMHKKHPEWSKEECKGVSNHAIWNGMTVEMMKASLGPYNDVNISDYGYGRQYQYCYDTCFLYDDNDDGVIDAYQTY